MPHELLCLGLLLLSAAALVACAGEPSDASTSDAPTTDSRPTADGIGVPAEERTGQPTDSASAPTGSSEWTVGVVEVDGAGEGQAVLGDVRVAAHHGYDRLAFEFGAVRPAVHVEYVDEPVRTCSSGHAMDLPGDAWLLIRFSGARAHTEAGEPTVDPARRDLDLPNALTLARTCDFEGEVSWVLAVDSPEPVRVTTLDGPPRVAVDVQHP